MRWFAGEIVLRLEACVVVFSCALGCGASADDGDGDNSGSDASSEEVDPCVINPYRCDCEHIAVSVTEKVRCVGTPPCDHVADCPSIDSAWVPICEDRGDVPSWISTGVCMIPCSSACPAGMHCSGVTCWFEQNPQ